MVHMPRLGGLIDAFINNLDEASLSFGRDKLLAAILVEIKEEIESLKGSISLLEDGASDSFKVETVERVDLGDLND